MAPKQASCQENAVVAFVDLMMGQRWSVFVAAFVVAMAVAAVAAVAADNILEEYIVWAFELAFVGVRKRNLGLSFAERNGCCVIAVAAVAAVVVVVVVVVDDDDDGDDDEDDDYYY